MPRPPFFASSNVGLSALDHTCPASKNGDTVSGRYGKLISPYSGTPNSGMRSSALSNPSRLPRRRENAGQLPGSPEANDAVHSSWSMEP